MSGRVGYVWGGKIDFVVWWVEGWGGRLGRGIGRD